MCNSHNSQTKIKKMGGQKRKIEIEEIEERSKPVMFSKRRKGLFSKAEELCRLYPITRIAILVPPFAPNSHVPFYNFGHSSVDKVVNTFLDDPKNIGSESWFWWEDERFDTLEDLDELNEAGDSILMILNKARRRLADLEKSNQTDNSSLGNHHHHHEEEESKDLVQSKQGDVSLANHHNQDELNDLVQSNQRAVSLVNHHHDQEEEEELNDLVQSNRREVSLVNDHHHEEEEEEKVLEICKEETTTTATNYIPELEGAMTMPYYIPKLEGESSGSASCYFESEEDDLIPNCFLGSEEDYQIPDDFFNFDQDLLSSSSCFS